ncbi:MAG: hypothetical protein ABR612_11980 [Chromatocurvus sp.]
MALIDWHKTQNVGGRRQDSEPLRKVIVRSMLWLLAASALLALYAASWLLVPPLAG